MAWSYRWQRFDRAGISFRLPQSFWAYRSQYLCHEIETDEGSYVINWVVDVLSERSHRVKLSKEWLSESSKVPSGVPSRDHDLSLPSIFNMWQYVDDTTVLETKPKGQNSKAQDLVDLIHDWSKTNLFEKNCNKTKELNISSFQSSTSFVRKGMYWWKFYRVNSVRKATWSDNQC